MSSALRLMTIAPALTARPIPRAPRGGMLSPVNGRFYRGGWFMPRAATPPALKLAAPCTSPRPALDITRTDGTVTVANPETGDVDLFWIRTETRGTFAGRRLVAVLIGDEPEFSRSWRDFAFCDDFGVHVWGRFAGRPEVTGPDGYVALLTESGRFADRLEYRVTTP